MADESRIEELRRRVRKDPASLAFAQLAEELRRVHRFLEAVAVCRAGLEIYPGYLSARVTLGRCFIELNRLGTAVVIATHDLGLMEQVDARRMILAGGRLDVYD